MAVSPHRSVVLFNKGQVLALVASGISLWAGAAWLLGTLAPLGWVDDGLRAWTYALTLAGTWPAVLLVVRLARLQPGQVVPGVALVTLVALFIDGLVFGWTPQLYAAPARQLACAALVLWGAGCGLALAFLHEWRAAGRGA
ncbi:hypothetical protein ACFOON_13460 [Novosphingobium piscinae]|uniref:Uncharacterized protein n=1 Tax=Novosphingobium piscinae TaxID=1507448 RepID=A0A7X1G0N1_9SPHN|nr:hypothetical protein [Novosphingobium piscinae]MBC2669782.1 hypothetical protein [Novosphingobium piscinae]